MWRKMGIRIILFVLDLLRRSKWRPRRLRLGSERDSPSIHALARRSGQTRCYPWCQPLFCSCYYWFFQSIWTIVFSCSWYREDVNVIESPLSSPVFRVVPSAASRTFNAWERKIYLLKCSLLIFGVAGEMCFILPVLRVTSSSYDSWFPPRRRAFLYRFGCKWILHTFHSFFDMLHLQFSR